MLNFVNNLYHFGIINEINKKKNVSTLLYYRIFYFTVTFTHLFQIVEIKYQFLI